MKKQLFIFAILLSILISFEMIAQKVESERNRSVISIPEKTNKTVLDPLPAGTYSIGTGGYFPTIDSAFKRLSIDGIAGAVTLELINTLYTAPTDSFGFKLVGPIPGAGPSSRVTIKPAANKNVTIEGNGQYVFLFLNVSYLTLDGIGLTGTTALTIHALYNSQFIYNACSDFQNNSDHNVIQNITFISEDYTRYGGGPAFYSLNGFTVTSDSNLIQNNFIKKGGLPIYVSAYNNYTTLRAVGNIIRGNKIGSEADSLLGWAIQLERCQNTIVENNIVQNLKITTTSGEIHQLGINSYAGFGDIIRNNIVHNIKANSGYTSTGILLSGGSTGGYGSNNQVYNNMVYDIQSTSTAGDSRVAGIQMWYQNNPKIYYNTVYLSGNVNGINPYGSAALYIWGSCTNVEAKNNILVNTRSNVPFIACCINVENAAILTSDYNDLYYEPNTYNCLVRVGMTKYNTLASWQVTGKDLNSITEMPFFSSPDLHLDWYNYTLIDGHAIPITGITTDLDGDTRNTTTPDIGADEGMILPVELTSFTAEALDQKIIFKWTTATELNNNGFEVQRKVAESDFATIGFVRGEGTTTNQKEYSYIDKDLGDGKYFYRLKQIDFNGSFEYSDVIEVNVRSLNEYALEQNYPNPFNPVTTIGYVLKEKTNAKLILLNAIGEEVAVLVNEEQDKGFHKIDFNANTLASGVYFYRLQAGDPSTGSGKVFVQTHKMILLK